MVSQKIMQYAFIKGYSSFWFDTALLKETLWHTHKLLTDKTKNLYLKVTSNKIKGVNTKVQLNLSLPPFHIPVSLYSFLSFRLFM